LFYLIADNGEESDILNIHLYLQFKGQLLVSFEPFIDLKMTFKDESIIKILQPLIERPTHVKRLLLLFDV